MITTYSRHHLSLQTWWKAQGLCERRGMLAGRARGHLDCSPVWRPKAALWTDDALQQHPKAFPLKCCTTFDPDCRQSSNKAAAYLRYTLQWGLADCVLPLSSLTCLCNSAQEWQQLPDCQEQPDVPTGFKTLCIFLIKKAALKIKLRTTANNMVFLLI